MGRLRIRLGMGMGSWKYSFRVRPRPHNLLKGLKLKELHSLINLRKKTHTNA